MLYALVAVIASHKRQLPSPFNASSAVIAVMTLVVASPDDAYVLVLATPIAVFNPSILPSEERQKNGRLRFGLPVMLIQSIMLSMLQSLSAVR